MFQIFESRLEIADGIALADAKSHRRYRLLSIFISPPSRKVRHYHQLPQKAVKLRGMIREDYSAIYLRRGYISRFRSNASSLQGSRMVIGAFYHGAIPFEPGLARRALEYFIYYRSVIYRAHRRRAFN